MSTSYTVIFTEFVERHFVKSFRKKYKNAWDLTEKALYREFQSFDILLSKSIAEVIIDSPQVSICKTEFRIAGTDVSRHASGNRCIVALDKEKSMIFVLLVYHKNDIGKGNETQNWKQIIKENYPDYRDLC